jgi:hypothetical protein
MMRITHRTISVCRPDHYEVQGTSAFSRAPHSSFFGAMPVTDSSVYNLASALNGRRLGRMTPRSSMIFHPAPILLPGGWLRRFVKNSNAMTGDEQWPVSLSEISLISIPVSRSMKPAVCPSPRLRRR